jgi:hypothetical protein
MNKLVERLREDDFPVLFTFKDFEKAGYDKNEYNMYLNEGISEGYIDRVYNDIYTLMAKYRERGIPKGILSQMIEPNSYISLYYVLCEYSWIPEFVFSATSVTTEKSYNIETGKYGTFIYKNIYNKLPEKGIYEEKESNGKYKTAKPLRALCDLMYLRNAHWNSIDNLYEVLRIDYDSLEEDLKSEDFDELQGSFGIKNIEYFLECIRKELRL